VKTKLVLVSVLVACLSGLGIASAGSIKVWVAETLKYSDLNTNFSHIHNSMVGGHGARLVNADVSTSAAIAHSKMATPALIPKAWVAVNGDCTASPCSGVTSLTRSGTGEYVVNLTTTRANTSYLVLVAPVDATGIRGCRISAVTTSTISISCYDENANAAVDTGLSVVVLDDDN
jgi:hypothetical protein